MPAPVIVDIPVPAGPAILDTGDTVTVTDPPDSTFSRC